MSWALLELLRDPKTMKNHRFLKVFRLPLSSAFLGSLGAVLGALGAQESPKRAWESPKEPKGAPREPERAPRDPQESPREPSESRFIACSCSENLSFIEVKL